MGRMTSRARSPRSELGSASLTATQNTSAGAFTVVPGLSKQVTPGYFPLMIVTDFAGWISNSASGSTTGTGSFALFEDETQIDYREMNYQARGLPISMRRRRTPPAGVPVTYSLRFARYGGIGTDLVHVIAAASGPVGLLTVLEV